MIIKLDHYEMACGAVVQWQLVYNHCEIACGAVVQWQLVYGAFMVNFVS